MDSEVTVDTSCPRRRFHQEMEYRTGLQLRMRFNRNRSTILSVRRYQPAFHVSIHQMFLDAPEHVRNALAEFIVKVRPGRTVKTVIDVFIDESLKSIDYRSMADRSKFVTAGKVYDLAEIYDEINQDYFGGELDLSTTWYGRVRSGSRSQVTFGLYLDALKLVKIHRMLDCERVPRYFVALVMYHEILHHVCPAYVDDKGRKRIHNKEFKEREALFKEYERANEWLDRNREAFFSGKILQGAD